MAVEMIPAATNRQSRTRAVTQPGVIEAVGTVAANLLEQVQIPGLPKLDNETQQPPPT